MKPKWGIEDADVMVYRPMPVGWAWLRQKAHDYIEFTKLKLSLLVLFSALVGFFLGVSGAPPLGLLICFGLGNLLIIAGANALNQVIERDYDSLMRRTAHRPLPGGRMSVSEAWTSSLMMSAAGLLLLTFAVNLLTGLLALVALAVYVLIYTPMKRKSIWCTFYGAISGAIPSMMGWTAVQNDLSPAAWALFFILFFWQFPHFWAIAWLYRNEYAEAGYRMLPVVDPSGRRTGRQVVLFTLALIAASLVPTYLNLTTVPYAAGALILGGLFLWYSLKLRALRTHSAARQLMLASVFYLPVLMILMLLAKR